MKDLMTELRQEVYRLDENLMNALPKQSLAIAIGIGAELTGEDDDDDSQISSDDQSESDVQAFMGEYMMSIDLVRGAINKVETNTESLQLERAALSSAYNADIEESIKENVKRINEDNKQAVTVLQAILKQLANSNNEFLSQNPSSAEGRIRQNLLTFISRKFKDVLLKYHTVQDEYKAELSSRMHRQVAMAMPELEPEEIAGMIDRGEITGASDIIHARLQGGVHTDIRNALQDVQDKYRDVKKLEQNVAELNEMFQELGNAIEANGEMIDLIEHNVGEAQEFMEKGTQNIEQARKKQKKRAKKATFWAIVLALIIAVVLMIIFI